MTGHEKLAKIMAKIDEGHTVYFTTAWKSISVNKRTIKRFKDAGAEVFKASDRDLKIARGKCWDSVSGCRITFA